MRKSECAFMVMVSNAVASGHCAPDRRRLSPERKPAVRNLFSNDPTCSIPRLPDLSARSSFWKCEKDLSAEDGVSETGSGDGGVGRPDLFEGRSFWKCEKNCWPLLPAKSFHRPLKAFLQYPVGPTAVALPAPRRVPVPLRCPRDADERAVPDGTRLLANLYEIDRTPPVVRARLKNPAARRNSSEPASADRDSAFRVPGRAQR